VAVSKTRPDDQIVACYDTGQRHFGENRPKEMQEKAASLPSDIHWHFIGHLQTNKVKYIIKDVYLIHSVDSLRLLEEIDKRAANAEDRTVNVLLQVHIAKEEQKFGFDSDELSRFFTQEGWKDFSNVQICGLMGMATFTSDMSVVKTEFEGLKTLFDEVKKIEGVDALNMDTLSMGMSGDYELAIGCGATMVRVGSKIFGSRT